MSIDGASIIVPASLGWRRRIGRSSRGSIRRPHDVRKLGIEIVRGALVVVLDAGIRLIDDIVASNRLDKPTEAAPFAGRATIQPALHHLLTKLEPGHHTGHDRIDTRVLRVGS